MNYKDKLFQLLCEISQGNDANALHVFKFFDQSSTNWQHLIKIGKRVLDHVNNQQYDQISYNNWATLLILNFDYYIEHIPNKRLKQFTQRDWKVVIEHNPSAQHHCVYKLMKL